MQFFLIFRYENAFALRLSELVGNCVCVCDGEELLTALWNFERKKTSSILLHPETNHLINMLTLTINASLKPQHRRLKENNGNSTTHSKNV